ncbi:MAG: MFS transporter [Phycisphaeraceae bacterium]
MTPLSSDSATQPPGDLARFRVGTLQYTKISLFVLFGWLLWGDFCFHLMEVVIRFVFIAKLKSLDAPNLVQSVTVITIPAAMNFMVNPVISFRSDRYRSRWGRRIPFLLWATPFLTICLILIGYSDQIGRYLHGPLSAWWSMSPSTAVIVTMGGLMVVLQFFNMFIASVYYYLFNDVVPPAFLGRFLALFRLVGFIAGWVFNYFLLGHSVAYMREIFVGVGLLYFVTFMFMCWRVKEGQYPPPPPNAGNRKGVLAAARTYCQECFTHPFYLSFFAYTAMWTTSLVYDPFHMHFAASIGMGLDRFGQVMAFLMIPQILLVYPAGMLADRFHPLRLLLWMACILPVVNLLIFFLARDPTSYTVLLAMLVPAMALSGAAAAPTLMLLLPKDRYGQFGSADAMGRSLCVIIGSVVAGGIMDLLKASYQGSEAYNSYMYLWTFVFQAIGLFFLFRVYRGWLRYGGREHYVPPAVGPAARVTVNIPVAPVLAVPALEPAGLVGHKGTERPAVGVTADVQ